MVAKPLLLSGEQSEAVRSFGVDIGLSASAGSGKTTVLVEKYLEALKKHACTPQHILAVTFTDKAAGSMKQRLVWRCRELGLHAVARELENAWIGTLHSFCARVLRENPVECGVDPKFQILSAGDEEMWVSEILESLLREYSGDSAVMKLLVDQGENNLLKNLRSLYDADRAHARDPRILEISLFEELRSDLERQMTSFADELERIFGSQTSLSEAQSRQWQISKDLQTYFRRSPVPSWGRWSDVMSRLKGLDLRSPKTRSVTAALKDAGSSWALLEVQALSVETKRTFIRLYEDFRARYETQKREKGLYDFEDLLYWTYRALSGEAEAQIALRKRYQKQFEAIFVDEYQDTSQLQARIIGLIKRPDNLFVVGDALQSIYGFRHASPQLFEKAMESAERLELRENYRSSREILDFVNALFAQIFPERFRAMQAMRDPSHKKEPSIEWVAVPKDEEIGLDGCRVWEARTLADRLRALVESGAYRYKDIAILFRKTTSSRIFEKELEARGVPYFVQKGRGFFERLEIMDLINMLRIINNPHEDIPLAAVLRSPLVQLSDDALFWIGRARLSPEDSYYQALVRWEKVPELSENDKIKIGRFLILLNELKKQKERSSLSLLLREVLSRTAYEAKLLTRADGDLAQANVLKLIEMVQSYEEKNAMSLQSFVHIVGRLSESEEAEPEARLIGEDEDVVRILTVHAAKGLEFPCVFFADLGGELCPRDHTLLDASPEHGLGIKIRQEGTFSYQEDHSLAMMNKARSIREEEEQSRLLYVAMTRAKDHLILSGVDTPSSWVEKLSALFGSPDNSRDGIMHHGEIPIRVLEVVKKKVFSADKASYRPVESLDDAKQDTKKVMGLLEKLEHVQKPYQMLEDVTVSDVLKVVTHEEIEMLPTAPISDEDELPRNEYGTLFHKLMEISVRSSRRGIVSQGMIERLTRGLSQIQREEMEESFKRFWSTDIAKEIVLSKRVYPELPFLYKTPHGLLKGQIDLLYENSKGEWTVLDYKTNRIQPGQGEAVAKRYEWQLGLYALIFRELYGKIPSRGMLYFASINTFTETIYTPAFLDRLSKELVEIYPKVAFS
jgi:ATP-dependent helicase/nuclease subunit A